MGIIDLVGFVQTLPASQEEAVDLRLGNILSHFGCLLYTSDAADE